MAVITGVVNSSTSPPTAYAVVMSEMMAPPVDVSKAATEVASALELGCRKCRKCRKGLHVYVMGGFLHFLQFLHR
jgi:hypothetical protein